MIKNEKQYKITKTQIKKFEDALTQIAERKGKTKDIHPLLLKAQEDALRSQLNDLHNQIAEYEMLRRGEYRVFELESIEDMPRVLIQARIALGLSQKELAELLNLKEQQIQRYEANDYSSASFSRIIEVIQALNLRVKENIILPSFKRTFDHLFSRLKEIGIDRNFILSRIFPKDVSAQLESGCFKDVENVLATKAATVIGRVFKWSADRIFSDKPLQLDSEVTACFKLPRGKKGKNMHSYIVYAHYMALLILESTKTKQKKIPLNPLEVRETILSTYGSFTLKNLLNYVWDLGIPVLPLNDPGVFHGACWRLKSRNVIVLKQKSLFASRWSFDLLHELYHAGQDPEKENYDVIEFEETSLDHIKSKDEKLANQFAGNILLDGRAEELVNLCIEEAKGKVELLKRAVRKIAAQEDVLVDFLANYIAFRLSLQDINWWGTANNLQTINDDPWEIARDMFLQRINLSHINKTDRLLIQYAISD